MWTDGKGPVRACLVNPAALRGFLETQTMKHPRTLTRAIATLAAAASLPVLGQTPIPASYAMPAGAVDTTQPGFRVHPYATDAGQPNTLAWTEEQLDGLHGLNLADLSTADVDGYYLVPTVVNWNTVIGSQIDDLPPSDPFPGLDGINQNMTEEVLTFLEFATPGTYTMGVNSDDGFRVAAASLNPRDRYSSVTLGSYDGGRSAADSLFSFSVDQPGIYPFRLLYEQGGGDASVSWFTVLEDGTKVLVNDTATPGAIKAYAKARVAPPFVSRFTHNASGFSFDVTDDVSSLQTSSLSVSFNGKPVTLLTAKSGRVTSASYSSLTGISPGVTNTVSISYADNATPAHTNTATLKFVETLFVTLPPALVVPPAEIDKTKPGFLFRVHQIDSSIAGVMAANNNHAEAQLAGLLTDATGQPYANIANQGTETGGSYIVPDVINFALDGVTDSGSFNSANGYPEQVFPGLAGDPGDNIAGELAGYLDLKAGIYTFGVSSADGFRLVTASNPRDAFGITLGQYDFRRITAETTFNVKVTQDGLYPVRLVFWRQGPMADNRGTGSLEFYTVASDGTKALVNDSLQSSSVKAYWKRTADYGAYVSYVGPASAVSPFHGNDVASKNVTVVLAQGTTNRVEASSVLLTIDGSVVTPVVKSNSGALRLTHTATTTQVARMVHTASLVWADTSGMKHTNAWSFDSWRNTVLPAPLYFEDFQSTSDGPESAVPAGWTAINHTDSLKPGVVDSGDLNSDFYLGWAVVDTSLDIHKDFGITPYAPQELNGVLFSDDTNPLLQGHYLRAESDVRSKNQVQDVITRSYDLSGKVGVVLAFASSYEQNQDNSISIEYTLDNGATWLPLFYAMQDGYDSQGTPDIVRDGLGNLDVDKTFNTVRSEIANYADPVSGLNVGDTYGSFVKAPITSALADFTEGRVNDDSGGSGSGGESKRFEVFRVPGADNQKAVKFKFHQDGTGSWWWAIDNVGIYSVPSLVIQTAPTPGSISFTVSGGNLLLTWTGNGTLQSASTVNGSYSDMPGGNGNSATLPLSAAQKFFRVRY